MSIEIKEAKLVDMDIVLKDGEWKVSGKYNLISTTGVVVAKQGFNSYGDAVTLDLSQETNKTLQKLIVSVIADVSTIIGLTKED